MSDYEISEVNGIASADIIHRLNIEAGCFPPLQPRHLENGYWWLAHKMDSDEPVAFAGVVPMVPFECGYLKRCYVTPSHLGHGLQYRFLIVRELKAKQIGWGYLVSESNSRYSNHTFAKAGYVQVTPEQPWGTSDASYWMKRI
jgi:GNAT superfamily N-acetyltransferase